MPGYFSSQQGGHGEEPEKPPKPPSTGDRQFLPVEWNGAEWVPLLNPLAGAGPIISIEEYGGKCDDSTDDSAAWARAVAAVSSGGSIIMTGGGNSKASVVESGVNLEGLAGINILGQGGPEGGSVIRKNSLGGSVIKAQRSRGCHLEGLYLDHAAGGGVLAGEGTAGEPTNFLSVERCQLFSTAGSAFNLVGLRNGISHHFEDCIFGGGNSAILGRLEVTDFLNGLELNNCTFSGQKEHPLYNLGQSAEIHGGCVFEPNLNNEPLVLQQEVGFNLWGFNFHGCQTADASKATGVSMILQGFGIHIHGNMFQTGGGEGTKTAIKLSGETKGALVEANEFNDYNLGIDKNGRVTAAFGIGPNFYNAVGEHHNFAAAGTLYIEA
jgi:hypothetical protein